MQSHRQTILNISNYIFDTHIEVIYFFFQKYKKILTDKLVCFHDSTIAYGPLKGYKLSSDSHWGVTDRGGMILGIYEKEVLHELLNVPSNYTIFIDLGAADGYYAVGLVAANIYEKSYCYEMDVNGQKVILENAILNDVSTKVVVKAEATKSFVYDIPKYELDKSTILVDIEGAEFGIFTSEIFHYLSNSIIIIEIHDFLVEEGAIKFKKLIEDSTKTHRSKIITMSERDLSVYKELENWNDIDRWLICSEGRDKLMKWVRFDPL